MKSLKTSKLFNRNTFVIAFITIGLLTVYLIRSYELSVYKNISRGFLGNIIEEDYEEAFKYIVHSSNEDSNKTEELRNAWIMKMKNLREEGTYIKSYNNIKMYFEDRYFPKGDVELVLSTNSKTETCTGWISFNGKEISNLSLYPLTSTERISLIALETN